MGAFQALKMDDQVFAVELEKRMPALRRYASKLTRNNADAEDLTGDVLLLAWRCRHQFQGRSSVATWLGTIMKN